MRKIAAGWRLRSRERDHIASLAACLVLVGLMALGVWALGGDPLAWMVGVLGSGLWVGAYVFGLWEDGNRVLDEPRTYGGRR